MASADWNYSKTVTTTTAPWPCADETVTFGEPEQSVTAPVRSFSDTIDPRPPEWMRRKNRMMAYPERYVDLVHGPPRAPIPWSRIWWYTWRFAAMLAWAGGVWALAEWTK